MDGFDRTISAARHTEDILRDGYCVIPHAVSAGLIAALGEDLHERFERTPFCQGDFYGARTKRFGGLLKRTPHAEALVMHPAILAITQAVLGPYCDCFQLNLTQALQIHPGEVRQAPHRDQDMWQGPTGEIEYLINVMWPLTPYTEENGGTIIYPGTHRIVPGTTHNEPAYIANLSPGDALLFLGSTLHGAGANRTNLPRTGIIVSYSLGWLKPYENQWLVYPPATARHFSPDLAALVGYRQHRPNLGNYEGQCPSILLRGEPCDDFLPAIDEVQPAQAQRLSAFKALQVALSAKGTS